MAKTPAFYNSSSAPNFNGLLPSDVHRLIYNLYTAIYGFCFNVDEDAGTIATDYSSKLSTPMVSAFANGATVGFAPLGAVDTTVGIYYTPAQMNWDGMRDADIFTVIYDIAVGLVLLCGQLDGDTPAVLGTDYRANISTPLSSCLSTPLSSPPEGLVTSTWFYGMESYMANGCFTQGDLYKCLYDLYIAIVRICTLFDAGAGTMPATLLTNVGTPLNTSIGQYIMTPTGNTTTGS